MYDWFIKDYKRVLAILFIVLEAFVKKFPVLLKHFYWIVYIIYKFVCSLNLILGTPV